LEPLNRRSGTSTATGPLEQIADPAGLKLETLWEEEWNSSLIESAIQQVKLKVDPKHYQIFDLYVFKEWPVSKVSRTIGVSPARVYLVKHRIQRLIRKEIARLQSERDKPRVSRSNGSQ
jgi:RNA polymerase sigma-70 factor (ECF subfamily)